MKENNTSQFKQVILKLKAQVGVEQDREIARLIGLDPNTFAGRRRRGSLPKDKIELFCLRRGIDPGSILGGL